MKLEVYRKFKKNLQISFLQDYENFLSYLCKAYKGTATPQSCTQASYLREVNAKPKHSVCYKDSGMPTREKVSSIIVASWMH